ncbi:pentatricopeptide repeat-containing protein [Tripterygium wilfordii]|uniref:Pentatricopeptide repeat-containing protein n=1 Tax=Tripterygium wilfordii TaxID=458696 RepID=A0A7J7DSE7_TRIWF|nr:pentatricopeptide repeat-containing protein [Tripterygium wilfordii]
MLHHSTTKLLLSGAITRHFRTINTNASVTPKDDYLAAINRIANVVRCEVHPERTLNKLDIPVTSELVFRVLRACSNSPSESLRFFHWARSHYSPTSLEFEELIKILACHRQYSSMWSMIDHKKKHQNENCPFQLSPSTVSKLLMFTIPCYWLCVR